MSVERPSTHDSLPGGENLPNENPRKVACYWEDDSNPIPKRRIEKFTTQKQAEKWLEKQKPEAHWTPKIDFLTVATPVGALKLVLAKEED